MNSVSTETSAGDTPDMRAACPMEIGRIRQSFSLASLDRDVIFS